MRWAASPARHPADGELPRDPRVVRVDLENTALDVLSLAAAL
jgi:hypothetical protein